ncbi:MAG: DUF6148 family protein [Firmicutes bacterium]|nr:DUF6148 family protein [Bacillota bacterium]
MAKKVKTALEIATKHYEAWLEAELELTAAQSYSLGSRTLTRANLAEVRKQIEYWENKIAQLQNKEQCGGRSRFIRIVPRDL